MLQIVIKNQIQELLTEANLVRINNLAKSIELAEHALKLSKEINSKELIAKCLNQLALYYMITGEIKQSTDYSTEAIKLFEILNDDIGVAIAKYNVGGVYYKTNNYHLGLIYFIESLKIFQKHNDNYNQSRTEKSIGTIYEYIGDYSNALKFYKNAVKNAKKINDFNLESNAYNTFSGLLLKYGKVKISMSLIDKSIELKKQTNDVRGLGFAYYGKGKVYLKMNNFHLAHQYFNDSLKIHQDMGDVIGKSMAYNKLGQLLYNNKNYFEAIDFANKGLEISKEQNISMINIKLYKLLYLIHKQLNNSKSALHFLELFEQEKSSVLNSQTFKVIENYDMLLKMKKIEQETLLEKERQQIINKKNEDELIAMRARQDFLSVMSHEIRTPLNAITTIIPLLNENVTEEGKYLVESLKFASKNLINIVNDVLDFSKLDSKKDKLTLSPINLKNTIINVLNVYNKMAVDKGVSLVSALKIIDQSNYLIDETKFIQILNNLISNAIKFTEKGSVKVSVSIAKITKSHDTLLFEITDSGEGIKKQNLKEIFKSFSQIKPVLTRKQGGTGLGLAIVKRILELYKSEIKVKSTIGVGTCFYFYLKLKRTSLKIEVEENDFTKLKNKNVLLVEDTLINAALMKKLLQKWGINVRHEINGKLAVDAVKKEKFDFILMDIHMPEMNGYEATKQIKTTSNLNINTPILALTADTLTEKEYQNEKYFDGIIWKPFEIDKLYNALKELI